MGNTAKQSRLGLFQDSDFAGDLEDSKSTSGGTLCIFGSHMFVPSSWMCRKQTAVSHSSTESEIISLDAGLRMDGIPALDVWDLFVTVLHGNTNQNKQVHGDQSTSLTRKKMLGKIDDLNNVDFVSSNAKSSHKEALSTPCIDDHYFKEEELKCLYLTRIGRLDILWSVNKLARSISKWTKACDKRLCRLISYTHHTCKYKQNCFCE